MAGTCTYCGSDLGSYEPIYVEETRNGDRVAVGGFCNYACLSAYIDENELTYGTACEWSPD
ncbi:MAG: hypothetical protein V5A34_05540 [Halapricum sp.]